MKEKRMISKDKINNRRGKKKREIIQVEDEHCLKTFQCLTTSLGRYYNHKLRAVSFEMIPIRV